MPGLARGRIMELHSAPVEGGVRVTLRGDLTAESCAAFRESLESLLAGTRRPVLVIDMGRVPYIDSCGLGALIFADRLASDLDGCLFLLDVPPMIRKFFQITGLGQKFRQIQDLVEARVEESLE